ncbi:MAG TPA: radical SAM protein, partial [Treponemataceae bacterium]|nr:radical SAM protein [Treponemataceae bacterium]
MIRSAIILQPPLVQLNGPYPSGAYLASFFKGISSSQGIHAVKWIDTSNLFFRHLFSASGISRLFNLSRENALLAAEKAEKSLDGIETARQIRRYLSLESAWISWIDAIVSILCGGDRELCHSFIRSPHAPRGARMDAFLTNIEEELTADDARLLATLAIEDLADYITNVYDNEFSLIRYAESIAASVHNFSYVESALDRPLIQDFFLPFLESLWNEVSAFCHTEGEILFCISVPFPGCLAGALSMARSIKKYFGNRSRICMGGGYVNTELRNTTTERLWTYIDSLSFDRGFGGYLAYFRGMGALRDSQPAAPLPLRMYCPPELQAEENVITSTIVPDYSDIDFALYPRLADTPNPMHRMWSDGAWIKAYLAHGCYWHRCSFCDVSLDYIRQYLLANIETLYSGLRTQALSAKVRGIHLVDEAGPPRALRDFALANVRASRADPKGGLLSFWGNIRFEKTFTRDLAELLAFGGLTGVSGGIEIASPEGFKAVDKGIDLENLVSVCAAFKEAGVLVHSYLIYGYWNESEQDVIDSAEVMRQIFATGLVDSAFWHKFVLTRHSRVYQEWQGGMHRGSSENPLARDLSPIDEKGDFADNDLRFVGEEESSRYTIPLESALQAWMHGESLDDPVKKWFPYSMPSPRIAKDLIESYIISYGKSRDKERNASFDANATYCWTASRPIKMRAESGDKTTFVWYYLGEEIIESFDSTVSEMFSAALYSIPVDS